LALHLSTAPEARIQNNLWRTVPSAYQPTEGLTFLSQCWGEMANLYRELGETPPPMVEAVPTLERFQNEALALEQAARALVVQYDSLTNTIQQSEGGPPKPPAVPAAALLASEPSSTPTALLDEMERTLDLEQQSQRVALKLLARPILNAPPAPDLEIQPPRNETKPKEGEPSKPDANADTTATLLPSLLSAPDIAKWIKRKRSSVTSFLTRFAREYPDCRVEVEAKKPNEPAYLYRTADVWPALKKWMESNTDD
jgi:hypothetical protein